MNANRINNLWCKKCLWHTCRCAFQFPPSEQMCEADFVGGLPLRHQYRQTMTKQTCPACGDFRIVEKTSQRCQACGTEFTAAPEQAGSRC